MLKNRPFSERSAVNLIIGAVRIVKRSRKTRPAQIGPRVEVKSVDEDGSSSVGATRSASRPNSWSDPT
jgi:hypothetical protein